MVLSTRAHLWYYSGLFAPQLINNLETLILSLMINGAVQGKWTCCIPFLGNNSRTSTCYWVMMQVRAFFVGTFSKAQWKVLASLKHSIWYTSWLFLCWKKGLSPQIKTIRIAFGLRSCLTRMCQNSQQERNLDRYCHEGMQPRNYASSVCQLIEELCRIVCVFQKL